MIENQDTIEFGDSIANLDNPVVIGMDTMPVSPYLIHWGRDKMDAISQTTFSGAFSCMKIF